MGSSGKVLTIFLVIIAILLISLTAISLFFFQKETDRRKLAETTLEEFRAETAELKESLKETEKQNFLLQEKNKEADERVNDLSDELELEKGLREEMRLETVDLKKKIEETQFSKEAFAEEIKKKEEFQEKLTEELAISEKKVKELEVKLKEEIGRAQKLGELFDQQQEEMARIELAQTSKKASGENINEDVLGAGIELEEIIVVPGEEVDTKYNVSGSGMLLEEAVGVLSKVLEGRILSVDAETEFVIVSLGEKDGVEIGNILSVYRGDDYVGDIRVTRLQPEMSAADLIPPFLIRSIKKNDQVKVK